MPGDNEAGPFGTSMTMQEIEDSIGADEKPPVDLTKVMADGDTVPEAYRGKSVDEIIKIAEGARTQMNESTRAAQEAREAAARAEQLGRTPPPPPPEVQKDLTREQLKELYDEDPIAALEAMEQQALRRIERHVDHRLEPLTAGTVNSAENWARQEYPDEFALFGDKIKGMVDSIPNKSVFSTKKGWEDAVAYIRGQTGNFEKLVDHRANKANEIEGAAARERERGNAGFSGRSTTVPKSSSRDASSRQDADMGDEERQIAQRFINDGTFKDMTEYRRWQKMGG